MWAPTSCPGSSPPLRTVHSHMGSLAFMEYKLESGVLVQIISEACGKLERSLPALGGFCRVCSGVREEVWRMPPLWPCSAHAGYSQPHVCPL